MCSQQVKEDPWLWHPSGPPCTGKHTWVKYISHGVRECIDCGKAEALWADFGLTKKLPDVE